ncbi:MAG: urea carboxylase [Pseudomonadales bacterium]|nr:urea carboxylase [Pseudomonadales bacterium]
MFNKVLIANRGAIATRIIRTLKRLGVGSVAVYNEADAQSLHVQHADESVSLGAGSAAETYLDIEKIIAAAKSMGAQAIHPGYGFLSENTAFVERCEQDGLVFIGPSAEQMLLFGLKHKAREAAEAASVPLVPGSPLLKNLDSAIAWASDVGYPVMLKSSAGGGGIGMQVCADETSLISAWDSVKRLSANYFSNDDVFLEKFIGNARHIEVQIFGDGQGTAVSLGERDCSAQRRNQKVIEETPAPNLSDPLRVQLHDTAERLMASVNYRNAGTVEFIFDADEECFYFLEVNTRLQVEHGVTEEVWGVDLVEWMLMQAAGEIDDLAVMKSVLQPQGHAIQVRIYAEDPMQDFRPSAGLLSQVEWPEAPGLRIDHWIESGIEVPALFDPMLAKVIVLAADRRSALTQIQDALSQTQLYGIQTNITYVQQILAGQSCQRGELLTRSLVDVDVIASTVQVLAAGTQTTLQDYPGRTGLWHVGVPPSGPMDSLSFRLANQLLGNDPAAVGLEITMTGPTLRFHQATTIALCGALIEANLDEVEINFNQLVEVQAGQVLKLGKLLGGGARAYLAVAGGFQCPAYLGSCSTFTLGQFGGHTGRALRVGDVLQLDATTSKPSPPQTLSVPPSIDDSWTLRVIYGPHGAPDFFSDRDIDTFFDAEWEVHYNSSRTGVRLIGPKPEWARETGGEAGLHPSNIHDNAYAFGTVDFTGDMPVILGPDGPSLGGFVCPATVIQADLWKLGQLKAGAKLRFVPVSHEQAVTLEKAQTESIKALAVETNETVTGPQRPSPIIYSGRVGDDDVICRLAGDHFLLVELGPQELDIERRFKVHALMLWMQENTMTGVRELTPGIRSLQIHYDSQQLALQILLDFVARAIETLSHRDDLKVPSRIVHLPLSWNDQVCQQAIEKYVQTVRDDSPWCPSNLEFIRRINGLEDIDAVKQIVFDASYLVMGLGDVYLGAPVATPLDPRHRLVTTKYNPARTWTAENSVGIGGAYMCIYGMEGPGGYQFVGRTLQMWNRYHQTAVFENPWLLRFFDQIRFYPVSEDELKTIRRDFPIGQYPIKIEQTEFSLADYHQLMKDQSDAIGEFQSRRECAYAEELAQWKQKGLLTFQQNEPSPIEQQEQVLPAGVRGVDSPVSGSVWKVLVSEGDQVKTGDTLMILESMKMEIEVHATCSGSVKNILRQDGQSVTAGQSLLWLQEEE